MDLVRGSMKVLRGFRHETGFGDIVGKPEWFTDGISEATWRAGGYGPGVPCCRVPSIHVSRGGFRLGGRSSQFRPTVFRQTSEGGFPIGGLSEQIPPWAGQNFLGLTTNTVAGGALILLRPAAVVSGSWMWAYLASTAGGALPTAPAGWVPIDVQTQGTTHLQLWWRRAGAGEPASYTFAGGSATAICGSILAYTGNPSGGWGNQGFTDTGSVALFNGLSTPAAECVLLPGLAESGNSAASTPYRTRLRVHISTALSITLTIWEGRIHAAGPIDDLSSSLFPAVDWAGEFLAFF